MQSEILYMLGIVAAGFAVNYTLRALPFVLFAGRDRTLPGWIEAASKWLSPIIIACLVVYSYAGLSWRTPGPLVAGVVTVGLQIWKRNPLASIIAGTVVYMCFLNLGCTTARSVNIDARNPSIEVRTTGIYVGEQWVKIAEVPEMLEDAEVPKTQTIHILLDGDVKNLTEARTLMGVLAATGYTRPILVTKQHGDGNNKSGANYNEPAAVRHDDVFFMVTENDVRFGFITPITPPYVVKCLQDCHVPPDQLIRICGQAKNYQNSEVRSMMLHLEQVLRDGGYNNVKRFWLDDSGSKAQGMDIQPKAARPSAGGRRVIRYKGANE